MSIWLIFNELTPYLLATVASLLTVEVMIAAKWSALACHLLDGIKSTFISLYDESMDDEQREVALRQAALAMLAVSLKSLLILVLIILSFWSDELLCLSERTLQIIKVDQSSLPTSISLIIFKSLVSLPYFILRIKRESQKQDKLESSENYSTLSQGLHRFALNGELVARLSFERERRVHLDGTREPMASQEPVWVCGLARAGTTILTDLLYETGAFASLTYRQMPFPLAPHQWRSLSRFGIGGAESEVERAHGDGMMVSIDSPEALEEVFWRVHEPGIYKDIEKMKPHTPSSETLSAFAAYMSLVLHDARRHQQAEGYLRYIAKNNNHLIRLEALLEAFPKGTFIVPLRDPLEHAESLRRQHLRWIERHKSDPFSKEYMDWLAHHEFGSGHRPFSFESRGQLRIVSSLEENPFELSYWAQRWLDAYREVQLILSKWGDDRIIIVDYDELSISPLVTLRALSNRLNLSLEQEQLEHMAKRFKAAPKRVDRSALESQDIATLSALYNELKSRSITPKDR